MIRRRLGRREAAATLSSHRPIDGLTSQRLGMTGCYGDGGGMRDSWPEASLRLFAGKRLEEALH